MALYLCWSSDCHRLLYLLVFAIGVFAGDEQNSFVCKSTTMQIGSQRLDRR